MKINSELFKLKEILKSFSNLKNNDIELVISLIKLEEGIDKEIEKIRKAIQKAADYNNTDNEIENSRNEINTLLQSTVSNEEKQLKINEFNEKFEKADIESFNNKQKLIEDFLNKENKTDFENLDQKKIGVLNLSIEDYKILLKFSK